MKQKKVGWRRAVLAASSIGASHKAGAATVAGAGTALVISPLVEALFPLVAGFAAALVVHAWTEPVSVLRAIASAVVCVVIGGVGGPAAMDMAAHYLGAPHSLPATLALSFVLAATWPVTAPFLWDRLRAVAVAFTPKSPKAKGQEND